MMDDDGSYHHDEEAETKRSKYARQHTRRNKRERESGYHREATAQGCRRSRTKTCREYASSSAVVDRQQSTNDASMLTRRERERALALA